MSRVLFICTRNAGRSVMAEALFNRMAGGRAEGTSAGTQPQNHPHPEVVAVLREIGIDVSERPGRLLTNDVVQGADRIITMGCTVDAGACPAINHAEVEEWSIADPRGESLVTVRDIRDDIQRRVEALIGSLPPLQRQITGAETNA